MADDIVLATVDLHIQDPEARRCVAGAIRRDRALIGVLEQDLAETGDAEAGGRRRWIGVGIAVGAGAALPIGLVLGWVL